MAFTNIEDKVDAIRHIVGAEKIAQDNRRKDEIIARLKAEREEQDRKHILELSQKDEVITRLMSALEEADQRYTVYEKKKYTSKSFQALVDAKFDEQVENRVKEEAQQLYNVNIDSLVKNEIGRYPDCRIETKQVIDTWVNEKVNHLLYNRADWPQEFSEYFWSEARILADRLKDRDYIDDVDQGVEKKLWELRNGAWQRYINNYIEYNLTPFLRNNLAQQVIALQEVFEAPCPRCGNIIQFRLTLDSLSDLVKGKPVKVRCMYCRGFWGPTTFNIDLGKVFWYLTDGYPSTQTETIIVEAKIVEQPKSVEPDVQDPEVRDDN